MYNQYRKLVLRNGLRVVLVPNPNSAVVTTTIIFKVGSRYENEEIAGISHVLEHMHYKGTKKRPDAILVAEFIESIGGEHNAFTAKEYTGYYTKVSADHLEDSFEFLSDILLNSRFSPKELEKEKIVVLQELDMYEDIPMEVVSNRFERCVFGDNALGREIIGTKNSILSITPDDLRSYKEKYYTAKNAVLVIAGNVGQQTDRELIKLIERYFDFSAEEPAIPESLSVRTEKCISLIKRKSEQSHLTIGFEGPAYSAPDRPGMRLLSLILGGSMSSRMFVEIREKRNLAYAIRSSLTSYIESGLIETHAGVGHDRVNETITAIVGEYKRIKQEKIPLAELNKAKEIIKGRLTISFEDSEEAASHYAVEELLTGKIQTFEEIVGRYASVTQDDLYMLAHKYLDDDKMCLAYVGPSAKREEIDKIFKL